MDESINSEEELIRRVLLRDNDAFKQLIKQHQRLVFSIVFKMLNNAADREDICQEIFIKVYSHLPRFKFESKLSTWIARIAYTTCVNELKKKRSSLFDDIAETGETENGEEDFADRIEDAISKTPAEVILHKELKANLDKEIDSLPSLFKTIIALYHQEELSYEEIVEVTGLPIGTVKSYLFRARRLLKKNLLKKYTKEDLL